MTAFTLQMSRIALQRVQQYGGGPAGRSLMAESLTHIRHIKERLKDTSWFFRPFGWLLIIAVSAEFSFRFVSHTATVNDYIDRFVISGGFFLLLFSAIGREIVGLRTGRYANVTDKFEAIQASLKDLSTYLEQVKLGRIDTQQFEKSVRGEIEYVLDTITELFGIVTGTTCRAAIKTIFNKNGRIYVCAFTRDKRSNRINLTQDKDRFERCADPLERNEDFQSIFSEARRYFIENDLPRRMNYINSSFDRAGDQWRGSNWLQRTFFPGWGWPLPYRSTMVFPIQQKDSETFAFEPPGCIGFLAIDSRFRNVFRERFDCPIGLSLADALFLPLYRYVSLLNALSAEKGRTP